MVVVYCRCMFNAANYILHTISHTAPFELVLAPGSGYKKMKVDVVILDKSFGRGSGKIIFL